MEVPPEFRQVFDKVKYLVLVTRYTARLLDGDRYGDRSPWEMYGDWADGGSRIVSIKDNLWGDEDDGRYAWIDSAGNKRIDAAPESPEEVALKQLLEGHDGYVVIRLCDAHVSSAFKDFVRLFESGSDHAYCSCFHGIPYAISEADHPLLGRVVLMEFDTESG